MVLAVQPAGELGEIRCEDGDAAVGWGEVFGYISVLAGEDDIECVRIILRQRPVGRAQGGGEEPAIRCEYKGGTQITVPLTSGRPWSNWSV